MSTRKTVYKFIVPLGDAAQGVAVPDDMQVLSVQMQHGKPTMWVLCDPKPVLVARLYRWVGTGWLFDHKPTDMYLATVQIHEEAMPLVFHLFDVTGE